MIPAVVSLDLYRGDYYAMRLRLWEDSARTVPFDLTGFTAAAQYRDKPGGTTVVELAVTITLPNIVAVEITADLWPGAPAAGSWDLQLTDSEGRPMTPVGGPVRVVPDVTVVVPAP